MVIVLANAQSQLAVDPLLVRLLQCDAYSTQNLFFVDWL
jgi:hypothetical protein